MTHRPKEQNVFVTVGTTSFDSLIETLNNEEIQQAIVNLGFRKITMQIGRGAVKPQSKVKSLEVDFYQYKNTIADDIAASGLVISHAGAGSCLEVLGAGKALLVVVNETLMDNHQIELAEQLHKCGHLEFCTCSGLLTMLGKLDISKLKPFPKGNTKAFGTLVDQVMGVS